jgi:integrase
VENLNVSDRHGCRPHLRQILPTHTCEIPNSAPSSREDQCVIPSRCGGGASPNEDELGKALPETVIRQLDAHLHLLGPTGRAGALTATDLQLMHQTIYRILRDTGRRPGEVVSLRVGCIEIIDGQHNLIYDNHKAGRMRRRLPITTDTAEVVRT